MTRKIWKGLKKNDVIRDRDTGKLFVVEANRGHMMRVSNTTIFIGNPKQWDKETAVTYHGCVV